MFGEIMVPTGDVLRFFFKAEMKRSTVRGVHGPIMPGENIRVGFAVYGR